MTVEGREGDQEVEEESLYFVGWAYVSDIAAGQEPAGSKCS